MHYRLSAVRRYLPILLAMLLLCQVGCMTQSYTVGSGPQGGEVRTHRLWYAGWGFIKLHRLDTRRVVGAADNYRIDSGFRATDVILNVFTGPLGFFRKSIHIKK